MIRIIKIYGFLAALLFVFLCIGIRGIYALEETQDMSASVGVNPVFGVTVFPGSVTFPSVDPGETTADRQLDLECFSNGGLPWSLSIKDAAPLTSDTYEIPNERFHWSPEKISAAGTLYTAIDDAMSTDPFTFYECSATEYITFDPVELRLTLNVSVPSNQPAGTYMTTLVITMTE